jgi:pyrimidine operon attenuation protein/uracil phosphoribosyltransferase
MQEILSSLKIDQKINRLANQVLENCFEEKEIHIGGIVGNGFILATRLANIIAENADLKVNLFEIKLNKKEPWSDTIELTSDKKNLENGFIVLVDDVLNSGKTMQYALIELLQFPTKAIKTVVLVDRKHRRFPIKADFVGLTLSTTLKERVEVILEKNQQKAYLV